MLPIDEQALDVSVSKREGRPHVVALIGPTGVGKTTTIAKLAAAARFRDGHAVGLVTTDSFRMAAVDQLRSYAEILQVPLEVVIEPEEMKDALGRLNSCDVILIDSAGRSRQDTERLDVLRRFLTSASPDETHLVLSTTSGERTMLHDAEVFSSLGADRVVLTKLDETDEFGVVLNVINRLGTRISFVTTGQEVPDDIERGGADRIARMLLAGVLTEYPEESTTCEWVK
jgi:flagellar biosynthesis protein FlhF